MASTTAIHGLHERYIHFLPRDNVRQRLRTNFGALMRCAIVGATLLLAACYPSSPTAVPQQQRQQQLLNEASINTRLRAFGGELIGTDNGEWGGSVSFRTAAGVTYTVVPENSHGIYAMPYGVVALTGLAHLTINEGAVYALSQDQDGRVEANRILQLP